MPSHLFLFSVTGVACTVLICHGMPLLCSIIFMTDFIQITFFNLSFSLRLKSLIMIAFLLQEDSRVFASIVVHDTLSCLAWEGRYWSLMSDKQHQPFHACLLMMMLYQRGFLTLLVMHCRRQWLEADKEVIPFEYRVRIFPLDTPLGRDEQFGWS